ncbi:hypothetical protein [Burkholderia sp. LA-2-3-30-S1-D2]|uniref:hypothetical protein n=1 Tax=Burkholderia sp. LA-2-3-30-S1-D2 TaxID=1637862 RepID=UPI000757611D|nr:hypothetical protein [Burkholderia sp. LA-2-3-30-S1-D2]AOI94332.1 hypothetical protein WS66_00930 [Burkholderia sp. LA-2-3-30-S1-D2]KVE10702.1 hypothetical protein WS66_21835 [Burkholderia sp. LA-2-3-30-S1-D2]
MRVAPFVEQRHGFAHHRDEVHEQRLGRARGNPTRLAHLFFLFSFGASRPGAARQIHAGCDAHSVIRCKYAIAHRIIQFNTLFFDDAQ